MSQDPETTGGKRLGRLALVVLLALVALAFALIGFHPEVAIQPRPTAKDVDAAQAIYEEVVAERRTHVTLDPHSLSGLAALTRDALDRDRIHFELDRGILSGEASLPLPGGLWLNASAQVSGDQRGFPGMACTVGAISPPGRVCRWVAEGFRIALRRGGSDLPPLDDLILRTRVQDESVDLWLHSPKGSGLMTNLVDARRTEIDYPAVGRNFCRLVAAERADPAETLAQVLERAFAGVDASKPGDIRAAFVATTHFVVGPPAARLSPPDFDPAAGCTPLRPAPKLQGREDLAKHWSFSAGLTATFGSEAATSMGEWKELRDSLPQGSGFSFVDLAADRSGVRFARRALEEGAGPQVARRLRSATDEDLLPDRLLEAPEGMRDSEFTARYRSLDAKAYAAAIAAIDGELARAPTQ